MAIIFFPSGFREANREELSGTCEEAYTSWNRSHFPSKLLRIAALPDPERRAELFGQADGVARRLSSPWLHERVARSRDSPNP